MIAIYGLIWLAAGWKWGDWRNWKKYYSTILYFILGDFIYQYFLYDNYPMWIYTSQGIDKHAGLTHTHIFLIIMIIKYPATALIYLSKFPLHSRLKQLLHIIVWVVIYAINEQIDIYNHFIKYENGWSFWWSVFFNTVMFILLWVHYRKPLLAWGLSIVFIVFLWQVFNVPSTVFR
ncbi:hypothetical protein H5P36_04320 [Bacillus sp. APMAM]|uniref:CBO0543 family protein n=1 Tax=Margalitia sp. FSL K6-0131 TaxID=2954604 RepID=UPI000F86A73F|nr:hypothetical protein [Bacillus sp. APMAM]RTZ57022.1 hypothetical protein EKO25_04995 [Bacillus sp. SAJ1]